MTKILNNLRIAGTGSNQQVLGITGGFVNINNTLSIGDFAGHPDSSVFILATGSGTGSYALNIQDISNRVVMFVDNSGQAHIGGGQTTSTPNTLTLGGTNSIFSVGTLRLGLSSGGTRFVGDTFSTHLVSAGGRWGFGTSFTQSFTSYGLYIDTSTSSISVIGTSASRPLRVQGGATLSLSVSGIDYLTVGPTGLVTAATSAVVNTNLTIGTVSQTSARLSVWSSASASTDNLVSILSGSGTILFNAGGQMVIPGIGLTFGATNSNRQVSAGDIFLSHKDNSGIEMSQYGIFAKDSSVGTDTGLNFYLRRGVNLTVATYSRSFNFWPGDINVANYGPITIDKETADTSSINFPADYAYIRVTSSKVSGGFGISTLNSNSIQSTRLFIESKSDIVNAYFSNVKLGVNTTAPSAVLDVKQINAADNMLSVGGTVSNTSAFIVHANSNVSIGTSSNANKLTIWSPTGSALRIWDGQQGSGKVLTSDANGVASWSTASTVWSGGGDSNFIPRFSSTTGLTNSNMYQGSASRAILIGYGTNSTSYNNEPSTLRVLGSVVFDNVVSATETATFSINGTKLFHEQRGNLALGKLALGGNTGSVAGVTQGSYNLGIGYYALNALTTGTRNLAIGYNALKGSSVSNNNVAIGYNSLQNSSVGGNNVAVGNNSMSLNQLGSYSISIGADTLISSTQSSDQIAIGDSVLNKLTFASSPNIGIGGRAMFNNLTGGLNIVIGNNSLSGSTGPNSNIVIGQNSLQDSQLTSVSNNTILGNEAFYNTKSVTYSIGIDRAGYRLFSSMRSIAIGYNSLYGADLGTISSLGYQGSTPSSVDNIAIGYYAMFGHYDGVAGSSNLAIGNNALYSNRTGINQLAIGNNSLYALKSGDHNISIGRDAFLSIIDGTHNTSIGNANFAYVLSGGNNVALGNNIANNASYSTGNVAIGYRSLYGPTGYSGGSHSNNTTLGNFTLYNTQTASYNVAIGNFSLYNSLSGLYNIAIGYQTLLSSTGSTSDNIAIGYKSMLSTTSGRGNVAVGFQSLYTNNTGSASVAIGYQSMLKNTVGFNNVALGYQSLLNSTLSNNQIAIGPYALQNSNPTSSSLGSNIAIGKSSLNSLTYGFDNIVIGVDGMLNSGTISQYNVVVGNAAFYSSTYSLYNIGMGYGIGLNLKNAMRNIAIGDRALQGSTGSFGLTPSSTDNIGIGFRSMYSNYDGVYNIALGNESLSNNKVGKNNLSVGFQSLYSNVDGDNNLAVGYQALYSSQVSGGGGNIAFGNLSLFNNYDGISNIGIGNNSLYGNIGGYYNIGIGLNTLYWNLNGDRNIAIGDNSGGVGSDNIAIGQYSLGGTSSGTSFNIAIGAESQRNSTSANGKNTSIGWSSLFSNTSGYFNTAIGYQAMYGNISGYNNVAIGYQAGFTAIGNNNLIIGSTSGSGLRNGNSNVLLGNGILMNSPSVSSDSNTIVGSFISMTYSGSTKNTIIGANVQSALGYTQSGMTNSIILADGDGNQRFIVNNKGNAAVGDNFAGLTYGKFIVKGDTSTGLTPSNTITPGYDYINNAFIIKNSSDHPYFIARNDKTITINAASSYQYHIGGGAGGTAAALNIYGSSTGANGFSIYVNDSSTNPNFKLRNDGWASFNKSGSRVGIGKDVASLSYELDVVGTASITGNEIIGQKITSYNGVTTAGWGVPAIVGATSSAGLTQSTGTRTLYTSTGRGFYRIHIFLNMANNAGSATFSTYLNYSDNNGAQNPILYGMVGSGNTPPQYLGTNSSVNIWTPVSDVGKGPSIQYNYTLDVGAGSSISFNVIANTNNQQYDLWATLERLI